VTEHEKLEQRVRLGVEVETAKENLAHEREKALRLADDLERWAKWLRHHANKQPSATDFSPPSDADLTIRSDGRYRECLNFDSLLRLEESLRDARQTASNLELRRMQLSSPPGFTV
jgi:hypothetical protein